jgi:hypothetical protein
MDTRISHLAQQMPQMAMYGQPYDLRGKDWGQRLQAIAVEFRGRTTENSESEEESHLLLVCLQRGDMLIALTITCSVAVYEQNVGFYRWLLLNQLDVQSLEPEQVAILAADTRPVVALERKRMAMPMGIVAILVVLAIIYAFFSSLNKHVDAAKPAQGAAMTTPMAHKLHAQEEDEAHPCPMIATWNTSRDGVSYAVTLKDDGTFTSHEVSHDLNPAPPTAGTWKINGQNIEWTYASGTAGPASNAIKVDGPGHMTLTGNGADMSYEFANTIDSARCKG